MTELPEILPCPFCGGPAAVEECEGGVDRCRFSVGCSEEGDGGNDHLCMGYQSLTTFSTRKEAIEAWNKRAPIKTADRSRV